MANDFTPGQGGYEAWAAAGKPTDRNQVAAGDASPAFMKILEKSPKRAKTTGKSPQDTAAAALVTKVLKTIQDNADKAAKTQAANENATAKANAPSTPEEAQKAQDKQAAALVAGLQAMWAKGNLPADRNAPPVVDIGTANLKGGAANTATDAEVKAAADAEAQRTGQAPAMTTDKVTQLKQQIADSKTKLAAAQAQGATGGGGSFNPFEPGDWVDKAAGLGKAVLQGAATDLDYLNRPYNVVATTLKEFGSDKSMSDIAGDAWGALTGHINTSFSDIIKSQQGGGVYEDPQHPGQYVQTDPATGQAVPAKELNPLVVAPAAFAGDIVFNPGTYVGLSTVADAAKGFQAGQAARDAIDVNNSVIKSALNAGASKGVTSTAEKVAKQVTKNAATGKSVVPVAKDGVFNITENIAKSGGPISSKVLEHQALADKLYHDAVLAGATPADAQAAVRIAIEHEVAADAAKAKLATVAESALKSNKRVLNLKLAGQEIPLGKVPLIDIPYQGARALKAKAAATELGQGLSKMFSTRYWFPGETHTLFNKATSLGVHNFMEQHAAIRDAFKGLSKADRVRIADETEKGVSLAGEFGTAGKDLGPAQKFFQDMTAQHFNEARKVLGKYATDDEVKDYVYHHYKGGTPAKIKETLAIRKARLRDGATGEDRLTLQQAADMGLRPERQADKILLAHTADHQRQMVREMFNRKMIDTYGHVTDNPIMAKKLGLIPVKPPKLMKLAPGHALYMHPDVKKVYSGVSAFMGKNDQETAKIWRYFDKGMRGWKMANTTLRPGHHVRNLMGDMFMNYLDGVQNPYRYEQGLKMAAGNRAGVQIRVGKQLLNGDDVERLWAMSGANQGFISSEFAEGRNPLLNALKGFSQKREMTGRYAHFIDTLVKEGAKSNLGEKNAAGLYKIATEAGRRVNKWNINYADLTPFERSAMRRIMPFYTWMRKASPLMIESLATRPGRIELPTQINNMISNFAGINPNDNSQVPFPQWLKDVGFARLSDGQEPGVWSPPLPPQDLARTFGGGTFPSVAKEALGNVNPIAQLVIEQATGKNLYTGGAIDPNELSYAGSKLGVVQNILDAVSSSNDPLTRLNALTGIGTRRISENTQLSELRRQQDPLQVQMSQINKSLGNYEVHKLKSGYSVYDKHFKITVKSDFGTPEDALIYAIGLNNKDKGK